MTLHGHVQYSIATALTLALFLAGWLSGSFTVSAAGALAILLLASQRFAAGTGIQLAIGRFAAGLLLTLSYLMLTGSALYYLAAIPSQVLVWTLLTLPFAAWIAVRQPQAHPSPTHQASSWQVLWGAALIVALVGFFVTLSGTSTTLATRSPWLVASTGLLWWIALGAGALWMLAKAQAVRLSLVGSSVLLFAALSVVLFVFPLGYGFDPYLHQATLDHISLHGTITPKPYYYIGQYVIELLSMYASGLTSSQIDRVLLPLLTALTLPALTATLLWHITKRALPTCLAGLGALLLPLSGFMNTTPQGLANLWTLALLLLGTPELVTGHRLVPRTLLWTLALAGLAIHPLAGLPAILFMALHTIFTQESWSRTVRSVLTSFVSVGGAVMLPVAFWFSGTSQSLNWNLANLSTLLPGVYAGTNFSPIGDLFMWVITNQWLWLLALAGLGAWLIRSMQRKHWLLLPATAGLLLINAIILSAGGDFSFLIDYEQTNYTARVVGLALLCLSPLALIGFALGMERLLSMKKLLVSGALGLLTVAAITANVYGTYPRHDAYVESRGFTVGESDHRTVASIESHAQGQDYVVLANQSVSAAAIQDFGFAHYYGENNDVFYYPVPTGGPMYQLFIEMIEETATRDLVEQAMNLAGVDRAYFVVNDYWWSAERAIERAKLTTEDWFLIEDGATTVFVYER